jgi:hypothetical protein
MPSILPYSAVPADEPLSIMRTRENSELGHSVHLTAFRRSEPSTFAKKVMHTKLNKVSYFEVSKNPSTERIYEKHNSK